MRSPLAKAIAALAAVLERLDVRWYLFGAQAALLYGAARLTADIDVTVDLGDRQTALLVRSLEKAGFRLRVRDVGGFVATTRVVPLLHRPSGMPIDLVLAGPGLEDLFFKRRRWRIVDGVRIPVASPEDIIVMKVLAGRGKDEDDAVAITGPDRLGPAVRGAAGPCPPPFLPRVGNGSTLRYASTCRRSAGLANVTSNSPTRRV